MKGTMIFFKQHIIVCIICILLISGNFYFALKNEDIIYFSSEKVSTDGLIEGIYENSECKQEFQIPKNTILDSVDLLMANYSNQINSIDLLFELYMNNGQKLFSAIISGEDIVDNDYYTIKIDEEIKSKGKKYYFTIKGMPAEEGESSPAIYYSTDTTDNMQLFINGEKQDYNVAAIYQYHKQVYTEEIHVVFQMCVFVFLIFINYEELVSGKKYKYLKITLFLLNVFLIEWIIRVIGLTGVNMACQVQLLTYLCIFLIQIIITAVIGNSVFAVIGLDILLLVAALANYFVMIYRGNPIVPSDLFAVSTLSTVMGTYVISFSAWQLIVMMWLILWFLFLLKLKFNQEKKKKLDKDTRFFSKQMIQGLLFRSGSIILAILGMVLLSDAELLEKADIAPAIWDRRSGYYENGPLMNFMVNIQYAFIEKPSGYKKELAQQYLSVYEQTESQNSENPNIIIIMNESLTDFISYGNDNVAFNSDPLPFLHSLNENVIKGDCYVSVFGARTADSELEALTGHSMAFFPAGSVVYQQFPQAITYGLVHDLNKEGYKSIVLHPFTRDNWNRPAVYESMGFDAYYALEDFENPEMVRWVSDKTTYDKIIELYENKNDEERLFLFDITMQGHGGYNSNAQWENPIELTDYDLPLTREYLSSTYISDKAFQYLIEYFEKEEEPTIICMFGDHQPAVEDEFFELLLKKPLENLSLEETQKRHVTPYVIWANYDIETELNKDISLNQLSGLLKENANLELTSYEKFIQEFSKTIPVINENGYRDKNGVWYERDQESPYTDLIYQYQVIQYAIYCDYLDVG